MKPAFLFFILLQFSICSLTVSVTWTSSPSSPTGIQGQSVTITWTAELPSGAEFQYVKVIQFISSSSENEVIMVDRAGGRTVYALYSSRDADVNLTASENGTLVTSVFTLKNLNQSADQHQYHLRVLYKTGPFTFDSKDSPNLQLTVLVSPTITSPDPSPSSVTVNETQTAQLVCTATGHPAPSYNWTRDGIIVGTGSPFTTPAVTFNDDNACYTCIAYNDLDAKTANVCLNVQYQPRSTLSLESTKSTVCQNDTVSLTCTSGPANPAPSSYEFYNNGVLVGTSVSSVYEATAGVGLPAVNKFVCVPRNLLGAALENTSVEVSAKVPPGASVVPSSDIIVKVEGEALTLSCTRSGCPTPTVTWIKTGVSSPLEQGSGGVVLNKTFASLSKQDTGTYQCTVSNGVVGGPAIKTIYLNVTYKPYLTNLTSPLSNACLNDSVTLQCTTDANPPAHEYRFYLNDVLVHTSMSGVYQVKVPQAGNNEYKCEPVNTVGAGQNGTVIITKDPYVAPNFSNIIITGASVTVMWGNLHFPQKTMVTCWLSVKESSHGVKWMSSSNTSYGSSISCSFSGLQPSTLYHIHYALRIHENYMNGTIYVATPHKGVIGSSHPTSNTGISSTAFIAVIVTAVVIILLLILVVIWMRFKDRQKNRRTNIKDQNETEVQLQTLEADYENEGFVFRDTQTDGDMVLYEQVQNRDLERNQDVDSAPSIPMENLPEISEQFEREARATATDNQTQSKYQEPSYQSLDQKEVGAGKRFHDTRDSYGHLVRFTRRPAHNATISTEDQNPYQELQLENRSNRDYQSLQKKQRTAFNV